MNKLSAKEQQLKESKTRKIILLVVIGLIVACMVVAGVLVGKNNKVEAPKGGNAPIGVTPTGGFMVNAEGGVGEVETRKDTDKIRVQLLFDPMCPGCGIVDREIHEDLMQLVKDGEITLQLTPLSFLDDASSDLYSTRASNAIATVGNDSPEHFYPFINAIFKDQPEEGASYVPVTDEDLAKLAEDVGVSSAVAATFKDAKYSDWIEERTLFNIGRKDLFPNDSFSTPAMFVGGTENEDGSVNDALRVDFTSANSIIEAFEKAFEAAKQQ